MTITQALYILHRAGRIASPWLMGMQVISPVLRTYRIVALHPDGAAFAVPGSSLVPLPIMVGFLMQARPDFDDPATLGCLLALVREASRDRGAHLVCIDEQQGWELCDSGLNWIYEGPRCLTEGMALAHALIALADAVTPPAAAPAPTRPRGRSR